MIYTCNVNCFNGCRIHEQILQDQQYQVYDWNPIQLIAVHEVMSNHYYNEPARKSKNVCVREIKICAIYSN